MGRVAAQGPCDCIDVGRRYFGGARLWRSGSSARYGYIDGTDDFHRGCRDFVRRRPDPKSAQFARCRIRRFAVGDHWRACWVALVDARTALCGGVGMGVVDRFWWDHDRDRPNRHRAIVAPSQTGQTSRSAFAMGSDCNDPIGALAAVLAFEYVMVVNLATSFEHAMLSLAVGIVLALGLGAAGAMVFRHHSAVDGCPNT